jgi:hypothetical protein
MTRDEAYDAGYSPDDPPTDPSPPGELCTCCGILDCGECAFRVVPVEMSDVFGAYSLTERVCVVHE